MPPVGELPALRPCKSNNMLSGSFLLVNGRSLMPVDSDFNRRGLKSAVYCRFPSYATVTWT